MTGVFFSREGWRQLMRLNRGLGMRYIKAFVIKVELAAFLRAHAQSGCKLDTICQELHYHSGIYLLLKRVSGQWFITDIWQEEAPELYLPVWVWQRVKIGFAHLAAKVLAGWRSLPPTAMPIVTYQ